MSDYKISIVVPVFNVEKFIDEAMESLRRQTIGFENLEVIFVDDCSTDKSSSLIADYAERYPNVKSIYLKENSGAAGIPRNEAMKLATAEYIMFLDPDDYYTKEACERLYNQIKKARCDLVAGYYSEINEFGELISEKTKQYEQFEEKIYSVNAQYLDLLKIQNAFWCKIYKRSIIMENEISFPPHIPGQDTVFLCRYILCCKEVYYINQKIAYYRLRETDNHSISNSCNLSFFIGIQTCYRMVLDSMAEKGKEEGFKFVIKEIIDFYITKLLDSDTISLEDTKVMLHQWKWIFDYYAKNGIMCNSPYAKILFFIVRSENFKYVVEITRELKILRKEILKITEGRDWLADQQKKKDAAIMELESWVKQLEDARQYHLEQARNYEIAFLHAQNSINEQTKIINEKEKIIKDLIDKINNDKENPDKRL